MPSRCTWNTPWVICAGCVDASRARSNLADRCCDGSRQGRQRLARRLRHEEKRVPFAHHQSRPKTPHAGRGEHPLRRSDSASISGRNELSMRSSASLGRRRSARRR